METITVLQMYQAPNTGHNIPKMFKILLTWLHSWLIDTDMMLHSWVLVSLTNQLVQLMTQYSTTIIHQLTTLSDLLVMTVSSPTLLSSTNKTHLTMRTSSVVNQMLGKNGTSISFGVMKVKMKTKFSTTLLMVLVNKSKNGTETTCSLENGVLQQTLKPHSMTEISSSNSQTE